MNTEYAAKQLEALGNPTRLDIFRDLVKAGKRGKPVGAIKDRLDIPASTLSHHIAKLVNCGLLTQERESRSLICRADFSNMDALMTFLIQNCCSDEWVIE